jgi:SpoIID/LytB domain protein
MTTGYSAMPTDAKLSQQQTRKTFLPRAMQLCAVSLVLLLAACQGTGQAIERTIEGVTGQTSATIGPTLKGPAGAEPDIRVRIEKSMTSEVVSGPDRVIVRLMHPAAGSPAIMRTPVKVTIASGSITTTDGGGVSKTWGAGNSVEILPSDGRADGTLISQRETMTVGQGKVLGRYPGIVQVRPSDGQQTFDVIVSMGIESYVPGVLSHELLPKWPRQTNEAQAIAARSYAMHERWRARAENRAYDVEDTTADQVFGGATRDPLPLEATRTTRGLVLVQQEQIIRAYFSSTCGGRPASAAVAWPLEADTQFNRTPSLQGSSRDHACQQATLYRWTVNRSVDDISKRIRAWGQRYDKPVRELGRVRQVRVGEVNDAGRPNTFVVSDDSGKTYTLTAEELRAGLNYNVSDLTPVRFAPRDLANNTTVLSGDISVDVQGTNVRILGRGWGHGVGMCQWCAKGFADKGEDWRTMLKRFYPGADVVRAY